MRVRAHDAHLGRILVENGKAAGVRVRTLGPTTPRDLMHLGLRGMDPAVLEAAEGYYWSTYDPGDAIRNVFKIFVPTRFDPEMAPPGCQILIVQKLTPLRLEEVTDWAAHKAEIDRRILERLRQGLPGL